MFMNNKFEFYIENRLANILNSTIKDAMMYALKDGKRFRPMLMFAILRGFYLKENIAYPYALALEMIHTYSLIHDDLPCMDDDNCRRGKLTTHKKFNEAIAVLAGDGLLTQAFLIAASGNQDDLTKLAIIKELANAAGVNGMIYGQFLDLENENSQELNREVLNKIQDYKTGKMFQASLLIAMHLAKDQKNRSFYEQLGLSIGRIFQMQDDLFDITRTNEEMGKDSNSDLKNNKLTANSFYDIDSLTKIIKAEFEKLYSLLEKQAFDSSYLKEILLKMEQR